MGNKPGYSPMDVIDKNDIAVVYTWKYGSCSWRKKDERLICV